MSESVIVVLIVIFIIAVLAFIFKSFIKLILLLGIIYLIFHIGFLWDSEELQNNLPIFSFFKTEYREQIKEGYDGFADRRDEYGVIDTDAIEEEIRNILDEAMIKAENQLDKIDTDKLLDDLNKKLEELDPQIAEDIFRDLKEDLQKYLSEREIEELDNTITDTYENNQ